MVKAAGVVILYHPHESVLANISSYCHNLEKLYIIDNSEPGASSLRESLSFPNSTYIHDGVNQGIASRLNQAARMAMQEGYRFLLTMDQDSAFGQHVFARYLQCVDDYTAQSTTAMFGVAFMQTPIDTVTCHGLEVEHLITSGSIVNLDLFDATGGFDEALFIDGVDQEYCYRAISKGYRIVQFSNIFISHAIGHTTPHRSLMTFKTTPRALHSPIRLYYMTRNFLYLNRTYKNRFPGDISIRKKDLLNRIKNNLLYGNRKGLLIKLLFRAVSDYKKGKTGKLG